MKFKNILILLVVTMLTIIVLAGCPDNPAKPPVEEEEKEIPVVFNDKQLVLAAGADVTIPAWEPSAKKIDGFAPVVSDGSAYNIDYDLKYAVVNSKKTFKSSTVKNLIIFVENGVSADLIAESEQTYGDLIMNDFPVSKLASNVNSDGTTADIYSAATALYSGVKTKNAYLNKDKDGNKTETFVDRINAKNKKPKTIGLISNGDLADAFIAGVYFHASEDFSSKSAIYDTLFIPCDTPPILIAGKGDFKSIFSPGSSYATNEVYKSARYYAKDFKDAVGAITEKREFILSDHPTKNTVPTKIVAELSGNYSRYDTADTSLPNFSQFVTYGLSCLDAKNDLKLQKRGICLVVNDTAAEEYIKADNKEAVLKQIQNFDDAVAIACKFAFDDPDTLIIVTSGYVTSKEGITTDKVPVYAMGAGSASLRNKENFTLADLGIFLCSLEE